MRDGKDCTEQHAEPANDDVGDTEEDVPAANDGARADDDGFGSTVFIDWEVCSLLVLRAKWGQ